MEIIEILMASVILSLVFTTGFYIGVRYGDYEDMLVVGCWDIENTGRYIKIMVEDRDLEEVIDTARHEICHEINYRINESFMDSKNISENFARTCIPEDYLYLDD